MTRFWRLDPHNTFLNHGSFGACPRPVLAVQSALRRELEENPVQFFGPRLVARMDAALASLADFLQADETNLLFMTNATTAVNTVIRSLTFTPGDEILITDHTYLAVRNTVLTVAKERGVVVVTATIPFPIRTRGEAEAAILAKVTPRTRLAVLDHVTSPTALILPLETILPTLRSQGVLTLVDGAHAPGMIPLNLETLGADFYAGNLHKWVCAPKGAGFLWIDPRHHPLLQPLVVSNGNVLSCRHNTPLRQRFFWTGTQDVTPWLALPETLRLMAATYGPWSRIMADNHALALAARSFLCQVLAVPPPAPEEMIGAMAALPLPPSLCWPEQREGLPPALQHELQERFAITVPVIFWPDGDHHLIRISAHRHNRPRHYRTLGKALTRLAAVRKTPVRSR